MENEQLNNLLEEERIREFRKAFQICASYLSLPLYMAFWILDLIYAPQYKWLFLGLRALMIPVNLAARHLAMNTHTSRGVQWVAYTFIFFNSIFITVMIYLTEGFKSPYYAGLLLVTVGTFTFFPWSKRFFSIIVLTIFGPYYAFCLLRYDAASETVALISNSFFIASIVFVSIVIRSFYLRVKNQELESRFALRKELESREIVITEKTNEALQLAQLSKQFSPQVVRAITSGQLNLSQEAHVAEISVICIDIVNSTSRISRLDKKSVQTVISMFIDDTIKTLLKYDITIDKFMGDGILAFANDPLTRPDHLKRTLQAALEVRYRLEGNQQTYTDYWLNRFEVRMGISCGEADVGFYGTHDTFRSYTAIGKVVNLANRLCSSAEPSQIVVSSEVTKKIGKQTAFRFRDLGTRNLKGFEEDKFLVHELVGDDQSLEEVANLIPSCPSGHGVMSLETDSSNHFVFTCKTCDFIQDTHTTETKKAA